MKHMKNQTERRKNCIYNDIRDKIVRNKLEAMKEKESGQMS